MDQEARKRLWDSYIRTRNAQDREKIIIEYAPLVKVVAGRLLMYLGGNVEFDDLVSYGIFGLIDAIDKFDLLKDVKFETYASLRIRGSILDQIRKMDWIPRTVRQKQKQIDAAMRQVEITTGRVATDEEIAAQLGISQDEYLDWQNQMKITGVISLDEYLEQGIDIPNGKNSSRHFESPDKACERQELAEVLRESLEVLTDKERKVIELFYYEELTVKEISRVLEVTESRISQLHSKALSKMKTKMGDYMGVLKI